MKRFSSGRDHQGRLVAGRESDSHDDGFEFGFGSMTRTMTSSRLAWGPTRHALVATFASDPQQHTTTEKVSMFRFLLENLREHHCDMWCCRVLFSFGKLSRATVCCRVHCAKTTQSASMDVSPNKDEWLSGVFHVPTGH